MSVTTETLRIINEVVYKGKAENAKLNKDLETASTKAQKLNVNWGEMAKGLGIVTGAAGTLGAAYVKLYQVMGEGAQVQATQLTFDNLAMSIGTTSDVMINELQGATNGMISDFELMQAANRFTAMGLANTSTEAAKLAEVGSTLGAAFRGDAGAGMEEFALLLANQSIPRLDSFGISAGAVRTRIAELQEQFPDMSRETAFMQAVMAEAEITMGKLGDNSNSAAAQMATLESTFTNVKNEGSLMVTEALLPTLTAFNNLLTSSSAATTNMTDFQAAFGTGVQQALSPGVRTLDFLNLNLQAIAAIDYSNPITFLTSAYGILQRIESTGAGISRAKTNVEEFNTETTRLPPVAISYVNSMTRMGDAHDQLVPAANASTKAVKGFAEFSSTTFLDALAGVDVAAYDVEQALLQQAAAAGADQQSLVLLAAATGDYTEIQIQAALEMAALTAFIDAQAVALAAGNITWREALANVQAFKAELDALPPTKTVQVVYEQVTTGNAPGQGPSISSATGNVFPHGGYSMVGEFGPEFVRLPAGAQVISTNRTVNNSNSTTINGATRRGEQVLLQHLRRQSRPATILG